MEIDPSIYRLGRIDHPNRPYSDPRVSIHLDDGRSFVKKSRRSYDLATYALVDSLVLHSGYSSLRLESFLFTEEAFRDIKAKLKPGGAFVMYNAYRQGWVVGRLALLAEKVFGCKPIVLSLPHVDAIASDDDLGSRVTCLIVGLPGSPIPRAGARRRSPRRGRSGWHRCPMSALASMATGRRARGSPVSPGPGPGFALSSSIHPPWARCRLTQWPFLYLREPAIPGLNLRFIGMVAAISMAILLAFAPPRADRPHGQMFFLGAGFMLLESKGVVHMALLFGSTWVVNSVVFAAILVMILLSNLYVAIFRPRAVWFFYLLLGAALAVNIFVPMSVFLRAFRRRQGDCLVSCRLRAASSSPVSSSLRLSVTAPGRYRPRLERRGSHSGGTGRKPVAGAGVRSLASGRPWFLCPLGDFGRGRAGVPATGAFAGDDPRRFRGRGQRRVELPNKITGASNRSPSAIRYA